jgi:hypothetical protein
MSVLKAYLTYPMNPVTNSLLLDERWDKYYRLQFQNLTVDARDTLNKTLIDDLKIHGVTVEEKEVLRYSGKDKVANMWVRTNVIDGDKIRVRVEGEDLEDMVSKITNLKKFVAKFGYKPKQCVWDRVGRFA